jgi:His-Xaa-Ser system protein HxsD
MTTRIVHQDGDGLLFEVDVDIYGLASLQKVAHKFTDRCFVHLKRRDNQTIEVRLKSKTPGEGLDLIAGEFCNEILDQRLREVVALESESVRNLILAHALSRVGLSDSTSEELEKNDPRSE